MKLIFSRATCYANSADNNNCNASYLAAVTAINVTTWTTATVKAALDSFITGCANTTCSSTCKTLVSGVNVATKIANFVENFTTHCNPVKVSSGGDTTGGGNNDSAIIFLKPSLGLIFTILAQLIFNW
jgi:hypothetical protein